jgi:hypothetical protein
VRWFIVANTFVIVCLILSIIAGVVVTAWPQHMRLIGVAVALLSLALLIPHF